MNCPICGAPLGDGDQICNNCGTKRSEMGPAYNSAAQPSGQNSYGGGSYGNGNYGGGSYGNGSYGGGNYGNGGMGMPPAQGMGMNAGSYQRRSGGGNQIVAVIIAIVVLLGVAGAFLFNSRPQKMDLGEFSITFPEHVKEEQSSVFLDSSSNGAVYGNKKMGFAYMKYDLKQFGLNESDVSGLEEEFVTQLNKSFSLGLTGYERKDQVGNDLRFYFTEDGTDFFTVLTVETHGDGLYMFVAYCDKSNEGKYVVKFREMFDSIKFKD